MNFSKLEVWKMPKINSRASVDVLIAAVADIPAFVTRNNIFLFSFAMTVVFYLPALKNGSIDAGFLYMGDNIGYYLPALAKTQTLLSSLNFTAIDFSAYNGSSDYFLTSNFYAVHPMVVLYSLLVSAKTTSMQELGRFLVFMLAVHSFIACYFSLKLFTRFFSFEFGISGLIATAFAFSLHMMCALGEPEFLFSVCILPWAAYGALAYAEKPNLRQLIFACLPIVGGILGGYLPLGVTTIALSVVLVATKLLLFNDSDVLLNKRVHAFLLSLLPYACASLIVSPYLYSVYTFLKDSPGATNPNLFFSAHERAEAPHSLLRLFSHYFPVPGPYYEFSILWGFIASAIAALFLLSPKTNDAFTPRDWKIFKVSASLYFITVLSIYGEFSVVSDLVYYLIPQVGKMHIYQRFLLPMNLFLGIMIALMLKALIVTRPLLATRIALVVLALATLATAYLVGNDPVLSQKIGLNDYITLELLLGFLFVFALIIPGKAFVYSVTIVLFSLPALNLMYDYTHGRNTWQEQRKLRVIALDEAERTRLVSYLKRVDDKAILKYVDITPRWIKEGEGVEYFPKSFPYFVLNELQLSSYSGFNFYLSTRADYMERMPLEGQRVVLSPDWEMVTNTGADFVVAFASDVQGGALGSVLAKTNKEDIYRLPNDVVVVPLRSQAEKSDPFGATVFDNGYFKVSPGVIEDDRNRVNIAKGRPALQSSTFGGGVAMLAVDGNTDGNFNHGSVTHTQRDANAWLEVDLGKVEPIDSLKVWNRTDCCGSRLRDYWVFISEAPFLSSDTAPGLRKRPATWSSINLTPNPKGTIRTGGVKGRYVRIQLGAAQPIEESYLSIAELEVFRSEISQGIVSPQQAGAASDLKVAGFTTNNANYLRLDLESSVPANVEYLFWNNPRLKYYLNGKRVTTVDREGLRAINVPAGRNTIEIRYRHWPLTLFWVLYALYALALLWVLIPTKFTHTVRRTFFGQLL